MAREENVEIFQDTEKLCKENARLKEAVARQIKEQELVLESSEIPSGIISKYGDPARITVSKKRSFEAASAYAREYKTCVHNFASATNPGGGVTKGSSAQEECLCRCSSLYFSLNTKPMWDGFYGPHRASQDPLHNDDCIYTPGVAVFKTDTASPKLMPEKDWYEVDVLTCAAPNLRLKPANQMNPGDSKARVKITDRDLLALHEKRMRRMLDIASMKGAEVLILGAFGCGAFENPPEVAARAAKNVVQEYRHAFREIEFAVYCTPRDESNYMVYKRVMGGIGK